MKARILDTQVKVYSSMDANSVSIATLPQGSEVEFGGAKRKAGKMWIPITLSTGQQAYLPAETRLFPVQQGSLLQDNVELRGEPSSESMIKQKMPRNSKVLILEVIKGGVQDWVRVRDMNGMEGFISGETRIRVMPQKTKAMGRRNIFSGLMWLIAGVVIALSSSSPASGGGFVLFGYLALIFGAVMFISGLVQFITAPS